MKHVTVAAARDLRDHVANVVCAGLLLLGGSLALAAMVTIWWRP